jgi:hypothetical protein
MLTAEELLAGSSLTFEVEIPPDVLHPGHDTDAGEAPRAVRLRPLAVHDLQLISRAAKEQDQLTATLMVQRALVEPEMSVAQVAGLHVGLVQFLLNEVNRISGIAVTAEQLSATTDTPLAKAAFILAREFGWTPQEVNELTLGQVLLHLQMLAGAKEKAETPCPTTPHEPTHGPLCVLFALLPFSSGSQPRACWPPPRCPRRSWPA